MDVIRSLRDLVDRVLGSGTEPARTDDPAGGESATIAATPIDLPNELEPRPVPDPEPGADEPLGDPAAAAGSQVPVPEPGASGTSLEGMPIGGGDAEILNPIGQSDPGEIVGGSSGGPGSLTGMMGTAGVGGGGDTAMPITGGGVVGGLPGFGGGQPASGGGEPATSGLPGSGGGAPGLDQPEAGELPSGDWDGFGIDETAGIGTEGVPVPSATQIATGDLRDVAAGLSGPPIPAEGPEGPAGDMGKPVTPSDEPQDESGVPPDPESEPKEDAEKGEPETVSGDKSAGLDGGGSEGGGPGALSPSDQALLDKEYQAQLAAREAADRELNAAGPDAGGRSPIDPIEHGGATVGSAPAGGTASVDATGQELDAGVHAPGGGLVDPAAGPNEPEPMVAFSGPQYVDPAAGAVDLAAATERGEVEIGTTYGGDGRGATAAGGETLAGGTVAGGEDEEVPPAPPPSGAEAGAGEVGSTLPTPLPMPAEAEPAGEVSLLPTPLPYPADADDSLVLADLESGASVETQLAANLIASIDEISADAQIDIEQENSD